MNTVENNKSAQRKRIHPHKFTLWIALASIVMAFAGLTSAVIVKREQAGWQSFEMPKMFLISTIVIVLSSVTIFLALKAFKKRLMPTYRWLITITAVLGILFIITQIIGFSQLKQMGYDLGAGKPTTQSASFLYVIAILHMLHVVGGIIALIVIFFRAYSRKYKTYSSTGLEIAATYWHFVDILWIYLYFFLMYII
jgi:cytochrome c oxidase subunit III